MEIYVANIAYLVNEQDLQALFGKFGEVKKVRLVEEDGYNKGWGFVTMENDEAAQKAITALNLKNLKGKNIKVAKYRPKSKDPNRPQFGKFNPS